MRAALALSLALMGLVPSGVILTAPPALAVQPGEMLDRVDAVLNDAKDWLRDSETVAAVAAVLGLTAEQVDALFAWAAAQRA